jgi:hypothetical protein
MGKLLRFKASDIEEFMQKSRVERGNRNEPSTGQDLGCFSI